MIRPRYRRAISPAGRYLVDEDSGGITRVPTSTLRRCTTADKRLQLFLTLTSCISVAPYALFAPVSLPIGAFRHPRPASRHTSHTIDTLPFATRQPLRRPAYKSGARFRCDIRCFLCLRLRPFYPGRFATHTPHAFGIDGVNWRLRTKEHHRAVLRVGGYALAVSVTARGRVVVFLQGMVPCSAEPQLQRSTAFVAVAEFGSSFNA
ncbi:hypothetical protein C8F01DRAFT_270687 [Mycena amicta]|nr:hypothetical protein C8F01DRAFT_270687 [Mycena amicta]